MKNQCFLWIYNENKEKKYHLFRYVSFYTLFSVFSSLADISLLCVLAYSVEMGLNGTNAILLVVGLLIVIGILTCTNQYLAYKVDRIARKYRNQLQLSIADITQSIPYANFEKAEFIQNIYQINQSITTNGRGIQRFIISLNKIISLIIQILFFSLIILSFNYVYAILLVICIMVLIYQVGKRKAAINYQLYMENNEESYKRDYFLNLFKNKSSLKEIKLYRLLDYFFKKYDESMNQTMKIYQKGFIKKVGLSFGFGLKELISLALFVLMIYSNINILAASFYISGINLLLQLTSMIQNNTSSIQEDIQLIQTSLNFIEENKIQESKTLIEPISFESLVFDHVTFGYHENEYVLKDISFEIKKNEKIALIGKNGTGKSTLIKLICRFYQPQSGHIYLNGKDIWEYPMEQYVQILGAIFQDASLYPLTIEENITLSQQHQNVHTILEQVGLLKKVESLHSKEQTIALTQFSEDSTDFSGGEKQRIGLARTLYKQCDIVLLDEPTSAMDPRSEIEFFNQVDKLYQNQSIILITHRLSAVKFVDKIIFLKDGHISHIGSFDEMKQIDEDFKEMLEQEQQWYKGDDHHETKFIYA